MKYKEKLFFSLRSYDLDLTGCKDDGNRINQGLQKVIGWILKREYFTE